jgi:hypothetical protein
MNTLFKGKLAAMVLALSMVNISAAYAQDENANAKEEGNRNVMLNAASANGPREIQIGLPSADVNVLENGLPVTYATNPHSVNTIWRGDASTRACSRLPRLPSPPATSATPSTPLPRKVRRASTERSTTRATTSDCRSSRST